MKQSQPAIPPEFQRLDRAVNGIRQAHRRAERDSARHYKRMTTFEGDPSEIVQAWVLWAKVVRTCDDMAASITNALMAGNDAVAVESYKDFQASLRLLQELAAGLTGEDAQA